MQLSYLVEFTQPHGHQKKHAEVYSNTNDFSFAPLGTLKRFYKYCERFPEKTIEGYQTLSESTYEKYF